MENDEPIRLYLYVRPKAEQDHRCGEQPDEGPAERYFGRRHLAAGDKLNRGELLRQKNQNGTYACCADPSANFPPAILDTFHQDTL
ncbi:hypothetical protein [Arthrobacter sedimenti]|uniref:hypothetical protein n=1 Tax=Arthrobacter sedimenti TaxID=2694931 RepID=UPI0011241C7F|nr:hypothetical protein [Arthrobacter sedimenti]